MYISSEKEEEDIGAARCKILHYSISANLSSTSFLLIIHWLKASGDRLEQALSTEDERADLPLHRALKSERVPDKIVSMLVSLYPEAALRRDASGDFPLHAALMWRSKLAREHGGFLQKLMKVCPAAMSEPYTAQGTFRGMTPALIAASRGQKKRPASVDTIYRLLRARPLVVQTRHSMHFVDDIGKHLESS
mmetsp:Transcript_26061/g.77165  ORF Transcript_26061/g.77165 Transcript_26061/m.77165 type:complete len:192 (-) Transcript_26061:96-671(-)